MPKYLMCDNAECVSSLHCFRFLAQPSAKQEYGHFGPDHHGRCGEYILVDFKNIPLKRIHQLVKERIYNKRLPKTVWESISYLYRREIAWRATEQMIRDAFEFDEDAKGKFKRKNDP